MFRLIHRFGVWVINNYRIPTMIHSDLHNALDPENKKATSFGIAICSYRAISSGEKIPDIRNRKKIMINCRNIESAGWSYQYGDKEVSVKFTTNDGVSVYISKSIAEGIIGV